MRTDNASPCGRLVALRRCLVGIFGASNLICSRRNGSCARAFTRHYCSALALLGAIRSCRVALLFAIGTCSTSLIGRTLASSIGCVRAIRAQSLVQVIKRKLDIAKINVAIGIIGRRSVLRHRSRSIIGRHREGELAFDACRGQASIRLQILHARKTNRNRTARGINILELQPVARISRCGKRSVAVIHNRHRERNQLRLNRYAAWQAIGLFACRIGNIPCRLAILHILFGMAIRYQLGKGFGGIAELTEVDRAIGFVACRKQVVAGFSVLNRKAEFTLGKITASQALGSSNADFA